MLGLTRYQWTVLFAAWLGWGFDIFDGLLFNYVAPNAVPTLLGLEIGSPEAKKATLYWTGVLTSILLLGWAAGGVLFAAPAAAFDGDLPQAVSNTKAVTSASGARQLMDVMYRSRCGRWWRVCCCQIRELRQKR